VIGRGAADDLSGGAGADKFVYLSVADSATGAADRIRDFSRGEHDKLDLAAIDAKAAAGGNQAFSFIGQADFSHAGQVRFEVVNGHTVVQASTDGDTQAEFEIAFDNNVRLQTGDFIL
jgi:Ca2+-binding RTX toxin-like protein